LVDTLCVRQAIGLGAIPVNRPLTNSLVLLVAAMLALQLPICVCASAGHSHADAGRSNNHSHDALPVEHHESSHDAGHSHDASHSQLAGDHHPIEHAPEPESDGDQHDDSHPCECSPQSVPAAPVPKATQVDSLEREFGHWINQFAPMGGVLPQHDVQVMTHGPPFWLGRNLLSSFQGNPCALLCRWVI